VIGLQRLGGLRAQDHDKIDSSMPSVCFTGSGHSNEFAVRPISRSYDGLELAVS
jgi:hypothetical protein